MNNRSRCLLTFAPVSSGKKTREGGDAMFTRILVTESIQGLSFLINKKM